MLAGLCLLASSSLALAGTIEAINHTKWAINHFSVDGQSGIDVISPFQGGGGGCCYMAPTQWKPGMTVRVDWETGVAFADDVPEIPKPKRPNLDHMDAKTADSVALQYATELQKWQLKIKSMSKTHTQQVPLPPYTSGQKKCGITVHFLPCDAVKVTTSCADYGSPDYPIKEPVHMKEPAVCPK
nr:DUF3304 domain-containing protein [Nissabacter sp. SGAir0207]